jgi:hypothetical protein
MNLSARLTTVGCFALFLLAGCKGQGIGERCTFGVNSDCEQGLACFQGKDYGVCCPAGGQSCAPNPVETDAASPDASDGEGGATEEPSSDDGSTSDAASTDDGAAG